MFNSTAEHTYELYKNGVYKKNPDIDSDLASEKFDPEKCGNCNAYPASVGGKALFQIQNFNKNAIFLLLYGHWQTSSNRPLFQYSTFSFNV